MPLIVKKPQNTVVVQPTPPTPPAPVAKPPSKEITETTRNNAIREMKKHLINSILDARLDDDEVGKAFDIALAHIKSQIRW